LTKEEGHMMKNSPEQKEPPSESRPSSRSSYPATKTDRTKMIEKRQKEKVWNEPGSR